MAALNTASCLTVRGELGILRGAQTVEAAVVVGLQHQCLTLQALQAAMASPYCRY